MKRYWPIGLGIVAVGTIATAMVIETVAEPSDSDALLLRTIRTGQTIERYIADLVAPVRTIDRAGDGLDADDVQRTMMIERAQQRGSQIGMILAKDLNGDLKVTLAEFDQANPRMGEDRYAGSRANSFFTQYDADGDGIITLAEAAAPREERSYRRDYADYLKLDPDHDGHLTAAELTKLGTAAFAQVDSDGNGQISVAEYERFAPRVRAAQMAASAPRCAMPAVPSGAQLVVYGGYEADSLASVSIGGPDAETNLMDVRIEPGIAPVYLVLTSYESMVWRVSGATGRVMQVVASSTARRGGNGSGVVGIPRAKVAALGGDCPRYFSGATSSEADGVRATIKRSTGRTPDVMVGSYSAQSVSLPSGTITRADRTRTAMPRGFDPGMWSEALRYWPGGLVAVDPASVVARAPVAAYKVLPSQMGLAQLIGSGAVQRTSSGMFRIVRPIAHLPPSMGGAHSVKMMLAAGVPMPPGDPVHTCIVSEASGEPVVDSPICRMQSRNGLSSFFGRSRP